MGARKSLILRTFDAIISGQAPACGKEADLMCEIQNLYDLRHTQAASFLSGFTYPWEALKGIKNMILELGASLGADYRKIGEDVWIHNTATVAPTAFIGGPCIVGAGTEVRHCAYIRGSALIGENCVVGNSTELKNVILFDFGFLNKLTVSVCFSIFPKWIILIFSGFLVDLLIFIIIFRSF